MYPRQYHPAVIVTIDRAGRIVVPKRLRERFNLVAGTELEMVASGDCLQLRRASAEPALVRKKGILVHHGGARRRSGRGRVHPGAKGSTVHVEP